jgi:hypothetical protein
MCRVNEAPRAAPLGASAAIQQTIHYHGLLLASQPTSALSCSWRSLVLPVVTRLCPAAATAAAAGVPRGLPGWLRPRGEGYTALLPLGAGAPRAAARAALDLASSVSSSWMLPWDWRYRARMFLQQGRCSDRLLVGAGAASKPMVAALGDPRSHMPITAAARGCIYLCPDSMLLAAFVEPQGGCYCL